MSRPWTTALAAAVLAAGVAAPTLGFDFPKWDDVRYITANPILDEPLGTCLKWAVSGPRFQAYHPVHHAALCLQFPMSGSNPFGYRLVSLLLFALLGAAVASWLRAEKLDALPALIVTALVIGHPLHSESLGSVISQKDLLAMLFGVLALRGAAVGRSRLLVLALVLLAGLSKSGYLMFAFVVFARDWCLEGLDLKAALRRNAAGCLVAAAAMALSVAVVSQSGLPHNATQWMNPLIIASTVSHYMIALLVPVGLVPVQCLQVGGLRIAAGFVVLVAAVVIAVRRKGWLGFGLLAALFGIAPYLNVVPVPLGASTRFMPLFGLGAAVACVPLTRTPRRRAAAIVAAVALIALSLANQRIWRDPLTLWTFTSSQSRCYAVPFANLSVTRFEAGDHTGAEEALIDAISIEPHNERLYRSLVFSYMLTGDCGPATSVEDAQTFFNQIPSSEHPVRAALAGKRLASALVLALRHEKALRRSTEPIPAPIRSIVPNVRACNPDRGAKLEYLIDRLNGQAQKSGVTASGAQDVLTSSTTPPARP